MSKHGLFGVLPVVLILVVVGGVIFVSQITHAAPNHQGLIECEDGTTIPVSTGIRVTWGTTDFCTYNIDWDDVLSGGPPRDGIPPVYPEGYIYPDYLNRVGGTAPVYAVDYRSIDEANALFADQAPVIAVEINGDARAYPLGVLTRHEIANTTIGGVPVAVTFCPLCNSAIVYHRELDGQLYHFGVSGFLRNSDLIMWDHETESWWQQATGEGIVGEMTGTQLEFVTSSLVSYGEFKLAHPEGQVFVAITARDGELREDYNYNPYAGYDTRDSQPFLFNGEIDPRLPFVERIVGYHGTETDIAYAFSDLQTQIVINDEVDGRSIVVFWQPGATSALDDRNIANSREVGSATVFDPTLADGTTLTFYADGDVIKDTLTDSTWNIFGEAIAGELIGTQLFQERTVTHFWFAWAAFYPDSDIWSAE